MSYVKPSDFEDMMRPIARAAMNQGWMLKRTANGHVKWIPPKGPPVITSITNAAFKPNVVKLRDGGLVIPNDEQEKAEKLPEAHDPVPEKVLPVHQPVESGTPPKEKKRMLPRGSVQNAVINFFKDHPTPGLTFNIDDVVMHVKKTLPGATREVISTTCSQNAASGKLIRMGKGAYRYAHQDRRKEDNGHAETTPEEQEMLAEDEKVLDEFMSALAKLQDWAAKMRKASIQLNRIRKMLDGEKLQ